tara:strand:- start:115 stop:255 length:141 start_codon:yes stop_codon:yes gene_type:complete
MNHGQAISKSFARLTAQGAEQVNHGTATATTVLQILEKYIFISSNL